MGRWEPDVPAWSFGRKDEDSMHNLGGGNGRDSKSSNKKCQSKCSAQSTRKSHKRTKRTHRRESFSEDFDHSENTFRATFGDRCYTWSFREEPNSRSSTYGGFEWREHSTQTNHKTKAWDSSDAESDNEASYTVGLHSDRTTLGLPATGPLKLEDVKNACRLSALKWHPDKHQGPTQAVTEEKFKLCVNAYKSLCAVVA